MTLRSRKKRVYLAGGFRSGWQETVHSRLANFELLDPRSHGLSEPDVYTEWDLAAIRGSDYVLAYMEEDNPGGYELALELGYAKALGIKSLLIEEHPSDQRRRAFDMVREVADYRFKNLFDAIEFLRSEADTNNRRLEEHKAIKHA